MQQTNPPTLNRNQYGNIARSKKAKDHAESVMFPWIFEFGQENGRYPTQREIQNGLSLKSLCMVNRRVAYLESIGKLKRDEISRHITIPGYRFQLVEVN